MPYPYGKYDQIFVPEYNWGAMENVGAVTFNESYLFRSRVSDARREQRAIVVLHELSHMWFGNSVTMQWWNDLWLNESFATWASTLATSQVTEFTGVWATFASDEKTHAAEQDQLPSTHPIVAEIRDLGDVEVNFDAITYDKGASVLKQLVAWVGLDAFQRGVGAYLTAHAGGNATLRDLLDELERASGRDLGRWSELWLETAGVNTLRAVVETDAAGVITAARVEQTAAPSHPTLRPHRIAIGSYTGTATSALVRTHRVELDIDGPSTDVPELVGLPQPDLLLVNDDDLTYAKVRLDERSFATAVDAARRAPPIPSRARSCSGRRGTRCATPSSPRASSCASCCPASGHETQSAARGLALARLELAVGRYLADDHRERIASETGDAVWALAELAETGSDAQLQFVKAFTRIAATQAHADVLGSLLDGSIKLPGLDVDLDLRWELVDRPRGARRGIRRGDRRRARARRHRQGTPARRDRARGAARPGGEGCRVAPRRDGHEPLERPRPRHRRGVAAHGRARAARVDGARVLRAPAVDVGEPELHDGVARGLAPLPGSARR